MGTHPRIDSRRRASLVLVLSFVWLPGCASLGEESHAVLESRVESARTRADHDGLATHYEQEAKKARTSAQVHLRMLTTYQGHTGYRSAAGFARHCNRLAQKYADAEEEYLGLAKLHRKMAAEAKE